MKIDHRLEKILWTEKEILERTKVLAKEITEHYSDKETPVVVGVLKGCLIFFAHLSTSLGFDPDTDYIKISATEGARTKNTVTIQHGMSISPEGRNILIVEDIVDTATTLKALKKDLILKGAKDVKIVTLVDKPKGRRSPFKVDWVAFETDTTQWIAGFGIDINENMRQLPYIGILKREFE